MFYLSKKQKFLLTFAVILIVIFSVQIVFILTGEEPPVFIGTLEESDENMIKEKVDQEPEVIAVDVKGAVNNPGVYYMNQGDRIGDAIDKAGGTTEEADPDQLNLSLKVYDEMPLYVPKKGESLSEKLLEINDGKISINQASAEELQELDGIGEAKAKAIVDYRNEKGYFKNTEDIMDVSGIGQKTFDNIKDKITVN